MTADTKATVRPWKDAADRISASVSVAKDHDDATVVIWTEDAKTLLALQDKLTKAVKALERSNSKLDQLARGLETLAANSTAQAKQSERFPSLAEACLADAKKYGATAKNIRIEIEKVDSVLRSIKESA